MAKTLVTISVFLPTSSMARVNDFVVPVLELATVHRGQIARVDYSGPYADGYVPDNLRGENGRGTDGGAGVGRGSSERAEANRRAEADFADGEGPGGDGYADGSQGTRSPEPGTAEAGEPVKRGRGRPRKDAGGSGGAQASGTAAQGSERGAEGGAGSTASRAEGDRGAQPVGTREGTRQGAGEGQGGGRGAGTRGEADGGTRPASRVSDWGDEGGGAKAPADNKADPEIWAAKQPVEEWPSAWMPADITDVTIAELLSKHLEQSGDRNKTLAIMVEVTGEKALPNVHPDDYYKLARALIWGEARLRHGIK